jgi:hypothetical protein
MDTAATMVGLRNKINALTGPRGSDWPDAKRATIDDTMRRFCEEAEGMRTTGAADMRRRRHVSRDESAFAELLRGKGLDEESIERALEHAEHDRTVRRAVEEALRRLREEGDEEEAQDRLPANALRGYGGALSGAVRDIDEEHAARVAANERLEERFPELKELRRPGDNIRETADERLAHARRQMARDEAIARGRDDFERRFPEALELRKLAGRPGSF